MFFVGLFDGAMTQLDKKPCLNFFVDNFHAYIIWNKMIGIKNGNKSKLTIFNNLLPLYLYGTIEGGTAISIK
jgi:hypothetical protein